MRTGVSPCRPADHHHHTAAEGSVALAALPKCPYLNAETPRGAILPGLYELVHSVGEKRRMTFTFMFSNSRLHGGKHLRVLVGPHSE